MSNISAGRPSKRKILQSGFDFARDRGNFDVRLTEACSAAGLTTGAAYQIWRSRGEEGGQAKFQHDLALYTAEALHFGEARRLKLTEAAMSAVTKTDLEFEPLLNLVARCDFWQQLGLGAFPKSVTPEDIDPAIRAISLQRNIGTLALSSDAIRSELVAQETVVTEEYGAILTNVFDSREQKVREPFTMHDVARTLLMVGRESVHAALLSPEIANGGDDITAAIESEIDKFSATYIAIATNFAEAK